METPFEIRYHNIKLQVERLYKSVDRLIAKPFLGLEDVSFTLIGGECVHLHGALPSATVLLDALAGHTRIDAGAIWVDHQDQWLNLPQLSPRQIHQVQARTIGYLGRSEGLHAVPTVMDCVLTRLLEIGFSRGQADAHSRHVLDWVGLPRRLWEKAPDQLPLAKLHQVNLARTFAVDYSVVIIDLPRDHFDLDNQDRLRELIGYRKAQNSCFIGRFEQEALRRQVCDRSLTLSIPLTIPGPSPIPGHQPAPTGVAVGSTTAPLY